MVRIESKNKSLDELAKEHANYVLEDLYGKAPTFLLLGRNYIYDLLIATPKRLDTLSKRYTNDKRFNFILEYYENIFSKKHTKKYDAYSLASKLGVNVCPYCNRNYTFTIKNKDGGTRPEFDHFYDKATYPILALSFYNLIPSCHICNSSCKGQKKFSIDTHLHPYMDSFDKIAKFTFKPLDVSVFQNLATFDNSKLGLSFEKKDFRVTDEKYAKVENNIQDFCLEPLYVNHKDIILELIQKAEMYNKSYIDELLQKYEGSLFKNREDLMRLLFGGYISDEDIGKRPLSKLTKDILEQLEII